MAGNPCMVRTACGWISHFRRGPAQFAHHSSLNNQQSAKAIIIAGNTPHNSHTSNHRHIQKETGLHILNRFVEQHGHDGLLVCSEARSPRLVDSQRGCSNLLLAGYFGNRNLGLAHHSRPHFTVVWIVRSSINTDTHCWMVDYLSGQSKVRTSGFGRLTQSNRPQQASISSLV